METPLYPSYRLLTADGVPSKELAELRDVASDQQVGGPFRQVMFDRDPLRAR